MSPALQTLQLYAPLSELGPALLAALSARAIRRRFDPGEPLWCEGDPAVSLTVVARGRVKVVQQAPGGRDVLVEVCGPGDAPGDAAVLERRRHSSSAVALDEVEVAQIPAEDFLSILSSRPEAALSVLRGVARHVRSLSRRVSDLAEGGVERRLAIAMCRMCELVDAREGATVQIPVPLSRQDLADMVGTSIETAIRVMSRWARKGVVATEKDGFVVRDCASLQALVASTPRGAENGAFDVPVCIRKQRRS